MTIHLNNSSNPAAVKYNNTALDLVYASVNGVSSVFPVWSRDSAFPQTISLIRLYNSFVTKSSPRYEGKFDVYLRDLTFSGCVYEVNQSTGTITRVLTYTSQSSSFDLGWRRYVFVGFVFPPSDVSMQWTLSGSTPTITGIPSGFEYDSFVIIPDISYALDFKVSPDVSCNDYDSRIASFATTQVTSHVASIWNSGGYTIEGDSTNYVVPNQYGAWLYSATTGFVFQRSATVKFRKQVDSIPFS